jgi:peptide/nickel transport system permease protein
VLRYLAKRVVHAIIVVWAAFTLSFAVLFILPGDPVKLMLGTESSQTVSPQQLAALRRQYGTNSSFLTQYGHQLWRLMHGNLGSSYRNGVSVVKTLGDAAPSTLELAGSALVVGVLAGAAVAMWAGSTGNRLLKGFLLSLPPIGASMPTFWIGLILLQVVSFQLGWLPAFGNRGFAGLILPTVTLAIPTAAITAQVLYKSLDTTLHEPYVDVLRAKGVGRSRIFFRHALRNAALPTLTMVGVMVASLLGGSVLTETVFSRNGLGQIAASAVSAKDVPLVQGIVVFDTVVFVLVTLLVDVLYTVLDPRVRLRAGVS